MKLMKKSFLIISIGLLSINSLPTQAASLVSTSTEAHPVAMTTEKPILTLEKATESALSNSSKLALNAQESEVLKEQLHYSDNLSTLSYQQLYISNNQNAQQREFLKDQITYDIVKRYHTLVLGELEIKNLAEDIALKELEIQSLEAKKKVGLVTTLQLDSAKLELNNLRVTKNAKEETLRSEKSGFKLVTGKNLEQFTLEDTIQFEPLRFSGSPEGFFQSKVDIYLKYSNELAKLQEDNLFETFVNPLTGMSYAPTYAEYLKAKYNINSTNLSLKDTRDTLTQTLISNYAALLNMEEQIGTLETQIAFMENQLRIAEAQYKVGLMTKLDYMKQNSSLKDLNYSLKTLINSYNTLSQMLTKPWLMG